MTNGQPTDNQKAADVFMSRIMEHYRREDFNTTLRMIDEYIKRFGMERRIEILQERITAMSGQIAPPPLMYPDTPFKPTADQSEPDKKSDSWELRPADIQADIEQGIQSHLTGSPPELPPEEVLELSEEMTLQAQEEPFQALPTIAHTTADDELIVESNRQEEPIPNQRPLPSMEPVKPKEDTRPFEIPDTVRNSDSELEVSFQPTDPAMFIPANPPKEDFSSEALGGGTDKPKPISQDAAQIDSSLDRIPPADKEFVAMLEEELSKNRKKGDFGPSFISRNGTNKSSISLSVNDDDNLPPERDYHEIYNVSGEERPKGRPTFSAKFPGSGRGPLLPILLGVLGVTVVVYLIFVSGIFGKKEVEPAPEEQTQPVRARRNQPAETVAATTQTDQPVKQLTPEEQFDQLLKDIETRFNAGDIRKAHDLFREAKTIRSTDLRLIYWEGKISEAMLEIRLKSEEAASEKNATQQEEADFKEAKEKDTTEALRGYIKTYPEGLHVAEAVRRIQELEKSLKETTIQNIQEKSKASREIELRSQHLALNRAQVEKEWSQVKTTGAKSEVQTFEMMKIVFDYSTGLMWIQFDRSIPIEQGLMWLSRRHGGFSNWRLPTIQELKSLAPLVSKHFPRFNSGVSGIWSGDQPSEAGFSGQWIINLPNGELSSSSPYNNNYIFGVRAI